MMSGSRTRAAACGLAALTISALAGCNGGPQVARMAAAANRPETTLATAGRAALLPATIALDSPSELAAIEPANSAVGTLEPAPAPAATPLLDAALVRSREIADTVVAEMAVKPEPSKDAKIPEPSGPPHPSATVEPPPPPKVVGDAPVPPEPLRPEEVWRDEVHRLVELARGRAGQAGAGPWALRARVLEWLAGPEIDPDLGQREPDGVRAVLRVLDDPANPARTRGDEVRAAVQVLEDKIPLELVDLRVCWRVDSYGDYKAIDPPALKPGQQVVLYTEVDGLRQESTPSGFRTRLVGQVEITPADGGPAILARPLRPAEDLCHRRRRDYFVAAKLTLPENVRPGEYTLRVTWKDILADRSASREVAFTIARD